MKQPGSARSMWHAHLDHSGIVNLGRRVSPRVWGRRSYWPWMLRWPCRECHVTGVMTSGGGAWGVATQSTLLCPQALSVHHPHPGSNPSSRQWCVPCVRLGEPVWGGAQGREGRVTKGLQGRRTTLSLKKGRSLSWGLSTLLAPSGLWASTVSTA